MMVFMINDHHGGVEVYGDVDAPWQDELGHPEAAERDGGRRGGRAQGTPL